jgi:hypothetical protein
MNKCMFSIGVYIIILSFVSNVENDCEYMEIFRHVQWLLGIGENFLPGVDGGTGKQGKWGRNGGAHAWKQLSPRPVVMCAPIMGGLVIYQIMRKSNPDAEITNNERLNFPPLQ